MTEFAYSVKSVEGDAPDRIRLDPNLATGSVWENNDAHVETLDGKETLQATVGHTCQNVLLDQQPNCNPVGFRDSRNRRRFVGSEREILQLRKFITKAQFHIPNATLNADVPVGTSQSTENMLT